MEREGKRQHKLAIVGPRKRRRSAASALKRRRPVAGRSRRRSATPPTISRSFSRMGVLFRLLRKPSGRREPLFAICVRRGSRLSGARSRWHRSKKATLPPASRRRRARIPGQSPRWATRLQQLATRHHYRRQARQLGFGTTLPNASAARDGSDSNVGWLGSSTRAHLRQPRRSRHRLNRRDALVREHGPMPTIARRLHPSYRRRRASSRARAGRHASSNRSALSRE